MNRKKIIWIIAALGLVALVVFKLASNKKVTENKVYQYDKDKAISVQVDTIRFENIQDIQNFTGVFEPNRESKISAETQGKINVILVDVGSFVSKGQTLVQLDHSLLKLQLQTVEVQIDGLESDVNRYSILAQADAIQGVQLEKAQLGLRSAKVQRATLLEQISKATIKAPFSGVVTAKLNEVGGFAAPGVPLLQITDISSLRFTINVPENELTLFQLNQNYSITSDVFPQIPLSGKVSMIGSKSNMGNSFPVQFQLSNTNNFDIKSGMFGKVQIREDNQEQGIVITSSAIVGSTDQPQVYLIQNNKAVLQNISISKKIQNKAVVSKGLKAGDILITNGFINLFNEAPVFVN